LRGRIQPKATPLALRLLLALLLMSTMAFQRFTLSGILNCAFHFPIPHKTLVYGPSPCTLKSSHVRRSKFFSPWRRRVSLVFSSAFTVSHMVSPKPASLSCRFSKCGPTAHQALLSLNRWKPWAISACSIVYTFRSFLTVKSWHKDQFRPDRQGRRNLSQRPIAPCAVMPLVNSHVSRSSLVSATLIN
jgi:hypothetical protein